MLSHDFVNYLFIISCSILSPCHGFGMIMEFERRLTNSTLSFENNI